MCVITVLYLSIPSCKIQQEFPNGFQWFWCEITCMMCICYLYDVLSYRLMLPVSCVNYLYEKKNSMMCKLPVWCVYVTCMMRYHTGTIVQVDVTCMMCKLPVWCVYMTCMMRYHTGWCYLYDVYILPVWCVYVTCMMCIYICTWTVSERFPLFFPGTCSICYFWINPDLRPVCSKRYDFGKRR